MAKVKVLDHGYIEHVEHWGSDERIIEAARMSTDKGFLGWGPSCSKCGMRMVLTSGPEGFSPADYPRGAQADCTHNADKPGDEKLLRYLWQNNHATPFEMAGLTVEVQAPIFVFREWHRHRTQGYNELSARYTPMPDLNYIPSGERLLLNSKTNKQAGTIKGADELTNDAAITWSLQLEELYRHAQRVYDAGLKIGVPKELARLPVPVARYSRMRSTANLRNWFGFLKLRMDAAAQWEIRQYANAVGDVIAERFPRSWELFAEGMKR